MQALSITGEKAVRHDSRDKHGGRGLKYRLELLGHQIFYLWLRLFGYTPSVLLLYLVVGSYCLFSQKIHRRTRSYLKRMFPERSELVYRWLTYRLCCNFGRVLVERAWVGICRDAEIESDFPESDRMFDLMRTGRGVIIVNAHVGNWQMALSLLTESPVQINAHMRYDEEAAAKHWFDLQDRPCPFNIIRSDDTFGGMLEASAALLNGEAIVMMGDRWSPGTRSADVKFMGDTVQLPVSPYYLASATGALIIVLFSACTGPRSYRVDILDVMDVPPDVKKDSGRLASYAQRYATHLENFVRQYPLQWYNFYDYWAKHDVLER